MAGQPSRRRRIRRGQSHFRRTKIGTVPHLHCWALLDAPLLFVKRHSYTGIHIYDTYYKWPPGGGGIYVLENPAAPRAQWKIRPVIDPTTPGTLGVGRLHPSRTFLGRQEAAVLLQGRAEGQHEHLRDRHRRPRPAAPDRSHAAPATATRAATAASTTSPRPICPTAGSCSSPRGPAAWCPAPTRA